MMTREQFLLSKIAEEASELAEIAIKCMQYGLDTKKNDDTPSNKNY